MKHEEPDFVKQWRKWLAAGPPKCCHTCDFYNYHGVCEQHQSAPPKEFTDQIDVCNLYVQGLPF
jgi:hypothetical protein